MGCSLPPTPGHWARGQNDTAGHRVLDCWGGEGRWEGNMKDPESQAWEFQPNIPGTKGQGGIDEDEFGGRGEGGFRHVQLGQLSKPRSEKAD